MKFFTFLLFTFTIFTNNVLAVVATPEPCPGEEDRGNAVVCKEYLNTQPVVLDCLFEAEANFINRLTWQTKKAASSSRSLIPMDQAIEICFDFSHNLPYRNPRTGEVSRDGAVWDLVDMDNDRSSITCLPYEPR